MNLSNQQNYQISEDTIKDELRYIRTVYDANFKQAALVKNWCLTIWVAILIGIISSKITQNKCTQFLILFLPVFLFWILEAIYGSKLVLLIKYETELEDRIAKKRFIFNNTADIFASSWFQRLERWEIYKAFFKAFFTFETIVLFYLFIIAISALVVFW